MMIRQQVSKHMVNKHTVNNQMLKYLLAQLLRHLLA